MINPRVILILFAFLSSCAPELLTGDKISLKNAAAFHIGTTISYHDLSDDSLQSILIREFTSITPKHELLTDQGMPHPDTLQWEFIDSLVVYSTRHKMRLLGHVLSGQSPTPQGLREANHDSASLAAFLAEYIALHVSRYKNGVHGWNVVSDPVSDSSGTMHESFWYKMPGESFIDQAFFAVNKAAPKAVLFLNGSNAVSDTLKLDAFIDLVERLRNRGVPVSGIGLQMHLNLDTPDELIARAIKKAADTGLRVHLSELAIFINRHSNRPGGGNRVHNRLTSDLAHEQGEKYQRVAELYRNIVPESRQYGITLLSTSDKSFGAQTDDKIPDWPAIYDGNLNRKPAYYGLLNGARDD